MIVAASTTLLADSRAGGRGGVLPWTLLVVGSKASLAANLAVAEPTRTGRVIAAWPSFALIAAYELLMRQVRRAADGGQVTQRARRLGRFAASGGPAAGSALAADRRSRVRATAARYHGATREVQARAWQWAQANRASDGSLPSAKHICSQYGRQERYGRLVKRPGLAGELNTQS